MSEVTQNIPVLNMSCASCAMSTERMVQSVEGVKNAAVNFANATLTVSYDADKTNPEVMQKAVQSVGFDLLLEKEGDVQESLEAIQSKKYNQLKQKTIWAIAFTIPVVIIGMFFMNMPNANFWMLLFSTPVVLYFGKDFFVNAWQQAKHRIANMDTLVALSTGIAFLFSIFNMAYPQFWMDRGLHPHVYFEAAAAVIAFVMLGKLLEAKAKGNTATALKKLMGLQAKTLVRIKEGKEEIIPIEQVGLGDIILVKPGEKIAVDGKVINGNSFIDESMLSGEPIPVEKHINDKVFAGTINQNGSLQFIAEKLGKDTLLAQIIQSVQAAQGSKAPVQKLVDKIASIFVPIIILIAIITFIAWWLLGGASGLVQGLMAAVTVLVIACPCALGLATPTALMVGIGKAAEQGILIKDAESLELAKNVNAIVLDKTGTITQGKPVVVDMFWANDSDDLKRILLSIELASEHPLASAVVAQLNSFEKVALKNFESVTGKGVKAVVDDITYFVGSERFIKEQSVNIDAPIQQQANAWSDAANSVIWFADDKNVVAIIAIADTVKPSSKAAIQHLQDLGIEVYMLTGDQEATAKSIAKDVGIEHYKAGVLPQEKADFIKELQQQGKHVAMVGDGINDSTALALADVSIAMGQGSDIAMDVANMTIINSDLNKVAQAIKLSKLTVATIRQNLFWAFIYNVIGIPIAAGVLYPINGFLLNPMIAGAAMALSSLSVVSNSLLLKWKKVD